MNISEIKNLVINSLNDGADNAEVSRHLEEHGVSFEFSEGFTDRVLDRIFTAGMRVSMQVERFKSLNFVFNRIALTGLAAIVVLLLSIYLKEGSLTLNSLLGINDTNAESIVCLLTGN
jgi:hypothetical protein